MKSTLQKVSILALLLATTPVLASQVYKGVNEKGQECEILVQENTSTVEVKIFQNDNLWPELFGMRQVGGVIGQSGETHFKNQGQKKTRDPYTSKTFTDSVEVTMDDGKPVSYRIKSNATLKRYSLSRGALKVFFHIPSEVENQMNQEECIF